ncbi:hypothetical protein C0995_009316 [Termitomyces sp. Mi166|nr:hypothetical protein C0995_009316 [Termitomyces sp. Mi166\
MRRQTISSWFSPSPPSSPPLTLTTDNQYGLSSTSFTDLLATEYSAIHSSELVHLDHAASPPPPISAVTALATKLSTSVYSNPHSHAPTHREVDNMRSRVMHVLFGLNQRDQEGWDLVWTSGTSASLKLVAESFPWSPRSKYRCLKESHTSLVGVRGCALGGGAEVESLDLDAFLSPHSPKDDQYSHVLNAYPAQCNVTGSRLGLRPALSIARNLKNGKTKHAVLVDAAAYLSTSPLDLGTVPYEDAPDFMAGSFYKIYGHPTGLGFLLVKRASAHLLTSRKDAYFGGGAIEALSVSSPYWVHPRGSKDTGKSIGLIHERFENGTVPYLSIIALGCAIDAHQRLFTPRLDSTPPDPSSSLRAVSNHTRHLANLARTFLASLKHWDNTPLVRIHRGEGSERWEDDGPTIAFTLYTPSSSSHGPHPIGHSHLLNLATLANIQLRTGGLCNTGVLARVSGLSDRELSELWEDGRVCGDAVEFGGDTCDKPLGLARISFGACSSIRDIHKFIDFLQRYFLVSKDVVDLTTTEQSLTSESVEEKGGTNVYLKSLVRYPIKSCAGESLTSSRLTSHGLLHDREFAIVNSTTGKILSQKQFPRMVLIWPCISVDDSVMKVNAPGMPELVVPLQDTEAEVDARMCSNIAGSHRMSVEADEWVSKFLEVPCQLHRFSQQNTPPPASSCSTNLQHPAPTPPAPILFSNESPFTLISTSSTDTVTAWVQSSHYDTKTTSIHPSCFRANFTLSSSSSTTSALPPFLEDTLTHVRIGTQTFQVLARCRRCLMICVDPETGVRTREPFCCLAKNRRNGRRRVEFGVHLMWRPELSLRGEVFDGEMENKDSDLVVVRSREDDSKGEAVISVGDRVGWTLFLLYRHGLNTMRYLRTSPGKFSVPLDERYKVALSAFEPELVRRRYSLFAKHIALLCLDSTGLEDHHQSYIWDFSRDSKPPLLPSTLYFEAPSPSPLSTFTGNEFDAEPVTLPAVAHAPLSDATTYLHLPIPHLFAGAIREGNVFGNQLPSSTVNVTHQAQRHRRGIQPDISRGPAQEECGVAHSSSAPFKGYQTLPSANNDNYSPSPTKAKEISKRKAEKMPVTYTPFLGPVDELLRDLASIPTHDQVDVPRGTKRRAEEDPTGCEEMLLQSKCRWQTRQKVKVPAQVVDHHNKEYNFKCPLCHEIKSSRKSRSDFVRHIRTHGSASRQSHRPIKEPQPQMHPPLLNTNDPKPLIIPLLLCIPRNLPIPPHRHIFPPRRLQRTHDTLRMHNLKLGVHDERDSPMHTLTPFPPPGGFSSNGQRRRMVPIDHHTLEAVHIPNRGVERVWLVRACSGGRRGLDMQLPKRRRNNFQQRAHIAVGQSRHGDEMQLLERGCRHEAEDLRTGEMSGDKTELVEAPESPELFPPTHDHLDVVDAIVSTRASLSELRRKETPLHALEALQDLYQLTPHLGIDNREMDRPHCGREAQDAHTGPAEREIAIWGAVVIVSVRSGDERGEERAAVRALCEGVGDRECGGPVFAVVGLDALEKEIEGVGPGAADGGVVHELGAPAKFFFAEGVADDAGDDGVWEARDRGGAGAEGGEGENADVVGC